VVAINWNAWSQSVGTGGRNHPVRAGGGAWIYYGGMEGNQPSGMKIPSTSLMREIAEHLINLADQIDRSRHWP
jgi:hypothetical protein